MENEDILVRLRKNTEIRREKFDSISDLLEEVATEIRQLRQLNTELQQEADSLYWESRRGSV